MYGLDEGDDSSTKERDRDQEKRQKNKNLWKLIGSFAHYYSVSFEYVLWKISWINLLMYMSSIPTNKDTTKKSDPDIIDMNINDLSQILG